MAAVETVRPVPVAVVAVAVASSIHRELLQPRVLSLLRSVAVELVVSAELGEQTVRKVVPRPLDQLQRPAVAVVALKLVPLVEMVAPVVVARVVTPLQRELEEPALVAKEAMVVAVRQLRRSALVVVEAPVDMVRLERPQ